MVKIVFVIKFNEMVFLEKFTCIIGKSLFEIKISIKKKQLKNMSVQDSFQIRKM